MLLARLEELETAVILAAAGVEFRPHFLYLVDNPSASSLADKARRLLRQQTRMQLEAITAGVLAATTLPVKFETVLVVVAPRTFESAARR